MEKSQNIFPFMMNEVVGLSPFVRLRREKAKITFAYLPHLELNFGVLSPEQAIVLCAFDGKRTIEEIISYVAVLGDTSFEEAQTVVIKVMEAVSPDYKIFIRAVEGLVHEPFTPTDFLIPANLVNTNTRLDAPINMMFQPTQECQTNCRYCYACRRDMKPSELLTLEEIKKLAQEAQALGVYQVNLCGGDGFCRTDFVEIIQAFIDRGIIVDVSTKCYIDENTARRLKEIGLDYIQVSFDTFEEETADFLYSKPGHFKRIVKTIKNLVEAGLYTRTNSIITPYNFEHIRGTIEFLADLGITEMKFAPSFRSYYKDNLDCMISLEKKNEYRTYMTGIAREFKEKGITVFHESMDDFTEMNKDRKEEYWFKTRARCSAGRCSMVITPDGKVVPCEEAPQDERFFMGDLKKQSLQEVWNSPEFLAFTFPEQQKFESQACRECEDFIHCVHVMGHCFRDCLKVYGTILDANPFCPHGKETDNRIY